jgi:hypothetical protein
MMVNAIFTKDSAAALSGEVFGYALFYWFR